MAIMFKTSALLPTLLLGLLPLHAAPRSESGEVFDKVVSVLDRWYFDDEFKEHGLPELAASLRERAHAAPDAAAERAVINEMLSQLHTSHLALISKYAYGELGAALFGKETQTFGVQLVVLEGRYHAVWVYEGGPADLAGVKRGDEVRLIDGVPPGEHARLDWTTDDVSLPDPAVHYLRADEGATIHLELLRSQGEALELDLSAAPYSASKAAEASAHVIERDGIKLGYVHFWLFPSKRPSELLKELLEGDFKDCEGLILDLRGRGGSAGEIEAMIRMLKGERSLWSGEVVALTHGGTRSAKEVMAYRMQAEGVGTVVGETTAGAVIPAAFKEVGGDAVLMFPYMILPRYTELLEGKGVTPDVLVADHIPYSAGADPILKAGIATLEAQCAAAVGDSSKER